MKFIKNNFYNSLSKSPKIKVIDTNWSDCTTLGVVAPLKLVVLEDEDAVIFFLELIKEFNLKFKMIGSGSNILGGTVPSDLIIAKLGKSFSYSYNNENTFNFGAAITNVKFVNFITGKGYGGVAPIKFIPGNLSGTIIMNAGAHGVTISDYLTSVTILTKDCEKLTLNKDDLYFSYRSSKFPDSSIIIEATFSFPKIDLEQEKELLERLKKQRLDTNPKGKSAGCFFKNPSTELSAGKLIDQAGCKNMKVGEAEVSNIHANFIINKNNATEADVFNLAKKIKKEVFNKFGVNLMPEVEIVNQDFSAELNKKQYKIAVLKGGVSAEREVSLESGTAVANALRDAGFNVIEVDIKELKITDEIKSADVVFPVLHGGFGENGEIQELLESHNIEFVGSKSAACKIIMDKVATKEKLKEHKLPVPNDAILEKNNKTFPSNLVPPVVTKPPKDGSSFGLSLVEEMSAWEAAVELAYKYDERVLVEEYVEGVEITVPVVNNKPLPAVEVSYPTKIYDYDAKYTYKYGKTQYYCPPKNITDEQHKKAQEIAIKFCEVIGARDVIRVDMIVRADGHIVILEGNALPGFTQSSLLPKSAISSGITFTELCAKLVLNAINRKSS
jgi:D-alanine-D-alanine ligase